MSRYDWGQRHPGIEHHLHRPDILLEVKLTLVRPLQRMPAKPHDNHPLRDVGAECLHVRLGVLQCKYDLGPARGEIPPAR